MTDEPLAAPAPTNSPSPKPAAGSKKDKIERTTIILAKNPDIPPTGLYIGHNGTGYLLKPGKEADVPNFILDILDNAVETKPIIGDDGRVNGTEDSPRFPYRTVRNKK